MANRTINMIFFKKTVYMRGVLKLPKNYHMGSII